MILLLGFAFLSGLVTILAPCIWPLLPIILSSSVAGSGKTRPLGITLGIMLSFTVLTLAISYLVRLFHFDPNILRTIAVVVITFLGLSMIVPRLAEMVEIAISRLSGLFGQAGQRSGGFGSGFVTGLSLGVVWTPCAGPVLASIAALSATGRVSLEVVLVTIAYVLGIGIPLFIFSFGGQQIFTRVSFVSVHTRGIQQFFGVIMILTALAIFFNYDKIIQARLLNAFPQFNSTVNNFESNSAVKQQLDVLDSRRSLDTSMSAELFNANLPAPDFVGITKWLNTENSQSLSLSQLRGKVVLVDFWTYTCINCIRTLPHVTSWYDKYHDFGFVVVGVHTPEFEFEKDTNNVLGAIKQYGIHYPVAQDNDYATWNNYHNQYWPAEYLIDSEGVIRRVHFGEGEYDKMEEAIQTLLRNAGQKVTSTLVDMPDQTPTTSLSPETYLGSKRMGYFYPSGSVGNGTRTFTLADHPTENSFSLGGEWTITDENAIAGKEATLNYNFLANKVFLVLRPGSAGTKGTVKVFLDGKLIDKRSSGQDVKNGMVVIDSDRLYSLVDLRGSTGNHLLKLEFQSPGTQAFAFTFG